MSTKYQIDPAHSAARFSIKHMMIANVHGAFKKISGIMQLDRENLARSVIDVTIEASSIETHDEARDKHLRSADFFDVEKFPTLKFKSTKFEGSGEDIKVTGDLTIHGVTKSVVLEVEGPSAEIKDPWGNLKVGAVASTKIKRKDFGLTWNAALETGGILVGDDVKIELDVQFAKVA